MQKLHVFKSKRENKIYIIDPKVHNVAPLLQNENLQLLGSLTPRELYFGKSSLSIFKLAGENQVSYNPPALENIAAQAESALTRLEQKIRDYIAKENWDVLFVHVQHYNSSSGLNFVGIFGHDQHYSNFKVKNASRQGIQVDGLQEVIYYDKKWGYYLVKYQGEKVLIRHDF